MSNVKKITSVFATLFCMGQSAVVNASTKTTTVFPLSSNSKETALDEINNDPSTERLDFDEEDDQDAVKNDSNKVHKAIRKHYSFDSNVQNPGRRFLFNFRGTEIRPTDNLLEGEKIYYHNIPNFGGLLNCGINAEQAQAFYNEAQVCKRLKNEIWRKQYGDNSAWQKDKHMMNDELTTLSDLVKKQAVDYYKTSINRDENISKLRNYSSYLGEEIDKLIEALENSDWSDEDEDEISNTIKEYNENPNVKLLWYSQTDACPLRNVIIKLGEAKIIHLYTKLVLKIIDEIENTDNLLNDDLYQSPPDGEIEKDVNVIKDKIMKFILDKDSAISKKLDKELSKTVLSSDGFFDKFNDYENYKKGNSSHKSNKPIIGSVN